MELSVAHKSARSPFRGRTQEEKTCWTRTQRHRRRWSTCSTPFSMIFSVLTDSRPPSAAPLQSIRKVLLVRSTLEDKYKNIFAKRPCQSRVSYCACLLPGCAWSSKVAWSPWQPPLWSPPVTARNVRKQTSRTSASVLTLVAPVLRSVSGGSSRTDFPGSQQRLCMTSFPVANSCVTICDAGPLLLQSHLYHGGTYPCPHLQCAKQNVTHPLVSSSILTV